MDGRAGMTKLLDDLRLYTNVPNNKNVLNLNVYLAINFLLQIFLTSLPCAVAQQSYFSYRHNSYWYSFVITNNVNEDTLRFLSADTSGVRTDTSLFPK